MHGRMGSKRNLNYFFMKSYPELNKENSKAFAYTIFGGWGNEHQCFPPFSGIASTKRIIEMELVQVFYKSKCQQYEH